MPRSAARVAGDCDARTEVRRAPCLVPSACPIVGFAAISGSGKTTLLLKLIPLLRARGLRIGLIKRAHHSFDTDKPGKDSYELRKAGASQVLVGSDHRWALVVENEVPREPTLAALLRNLQADELDLILVEGFKSDPIPKIEVYRPSLGQPLLAADDRHIVAVATDDPDFVAVDLPLLDLNRPEQVADFIHQRFVAR
jgi:molybdopterin-guanine dinucleotide biosynthesis protein B